MLNPPVGAAAGLRLSGERRSKLTEWGGKLGKNIGKSSHGPAGTLFFEPTC